MSGLDARLFHALHDPLTRSPALFEMALVAQEDRVPGQLGHEVAARDRLVGQDHLAVGGRPEVDRAALHQLDLLASIGAGAIHAELERIAATLASGDDDEWGWITGRLATSQYSPQFDQTLLDFTLGQGFDSDSYVKLKIGVVKISVMRRSG